VVAVVVTGVVAGLLGTLAMDLLNNLVARTGMLLRIDVRLIGRMAAGWRRGRFRYGNPEEMEPVNAERMYGFATHYLIGVGLAVPFVLGWVVFIGGAVSPAWALAYGVATTAASWFLVYPSMGLGAFGKRSPDGCRAVLTPLANHFFYGAGLALGVGLL
jgi:hypothetical protein